MASAISGFINTIRNAVYGEQVRGAIINALEQCYDDVNSPALNTVAFETALRTIYDEGILDIQTVTQISAMTNQEIIYRYNGTETGRPKGLYYYDGSDWKPIGSGVQTVANSSLMTDTNTIYKYTGTQSGMEQNSLYYHDGTNWVPISDARMTVIENALNDLMMQIIANFTPVFTTEESESVNIAIDAKHPSTDFTSNEKYDINTGEIVSATSGHRLKLIPVKPASQIKTLSGHQLVFFSYNKKYIAGYNGAQELTVPSNAYYVGLSGGISWQNNPNFNVLTNCYVSEMHLTSDDFHPQWSNVDGTDVVDDAIEKADLLTRALDVSPVLLEGNKFIPVEDGLVYYQYPFPVALSPSGTATAGIIRFYDENFNQVIHTKKNSSSAITYQWSSVTGKTEASIRNDVQVYFWFTGDELHCKTGYQGEGIMTFEEQPKYFKVWFDKTFSVKKPFNAEIPKANEAVYLLVDDTRTHDFWEQVAEKLSSIVGDTEFSRKMTYDTVRTSNRMRQAFRIVTWNIYGAGKHKTNWQAVKTELQKTGADIVGMQEVYDPLDETSQDGLVFADEMDSWHLNQFDDVGLFKACGCTSEFTMGDSVGHSYSTQSGYGARSYVKTEIAMPMWKHKYWSDHVKVSIYNTQLEVGTGDSTRLAQVAELMTAVNADTNPFIIIMGDFNEMSTDFTTWNAIKNAGFSPALDDDSTPTAFRGYYDNIFVNDRISIVNTDVIPYSDNGTNIADHDLVLADVVFDWSNIIAVKQTLVNCSISGVTEWLDRRTTDTVTITITPDSGYTLGAITCGQGNNDLTYNNGAITISGNTITVRPNLVVGDMWISCTAS